MEISEALATFRKSIEKYVVFNEAEWIVLAPVLE